MKGEKGVGRHQAKLLIARHEKGEKGSLPEQLPKDFVQDVASFTIMHTDGGVACSVHGQDLQEEMAAKYPAQWILWLIDRVGWFSYDWS